MDIGDNATPQVHAMATGEKAAPQVHAMAVGDDV